jgi:flavin reductase (DIM6/NTAB) family NADH-FMN oxidoreductase RutF
MSDERVEYDIAEMDSRAVYPWLTASIIPRPIAWVSTIDETGTPNLAPHSFTTVAARRPPTLCFVSVGHKDSLANTRATGEFVLNIGSARHLHQLNESATPLPYGTSEFDAAQVTMAPSATVRPPRVADSPVAFECRVSGEYEIGDCVMVFGEVLHISALSTVLADDGLPSAHAVDPLARLGRAEWSALGEVFALDRITLREWEAGSRSTDDGVRPPG